jgi:hypothetical protein
VFWERCDPSGNNCTDLSQASGQAYVVMAADVGHTIRAVEFASNSYGTGDAAQSSATALVAVPAPPTDGSPPAISGTAAIGQVLSESHGTWSGYPTGYRYQWQDCDSTGNGCAVIAGATSQAYDLTSADIGHRIRVAEYAVNAGGTSPPATSAATAIVPVAAGTRGAARIGHPTITMASARVPVSCSGGFDAVCHVTLRLTVVETARNGKVVAVSASFRRTVKRTVVLSTATASLSAPQTTTLRLGLGRVGRHLLVAFHLLKVKLTATTARKIIWTRTETFKVQAKHEPH